MDLVAEALLAIRVGDKAEQASDRRSPLTEYWRAGNVTLRLAWTAALPDGEPGQLEAILVAAGEDDLGVGERADRPNGAAGKAPDDE